MSFAFSPFISLGTGGGGGGGGDHNLLSATHLDTITSAPTGVIIASGSTWRALGPGTVGQVLQIASNGLPTWGSASAGSIVGNGGYATVGLAVLAGEQNIDVQSNTTETFDIRIYQDVNVNIARGMTVNMNGYVWTFESTQNLSIEGNGILQLTANRTYFAASGTGSLLRIEGVNLKNLAANPAANCLTDLNYARLDNVIMDSTINVCGDYNLLSDCIYRDGAINFMPTADSSHIAGGVAINCSVVDSGINCLMSDMVIA